MKIFRISHAACCRMLVLLVVAVGLSQGFSLHRRSNTAIITTPSRTTRSSSALDLSNQDFLYDGFSPSPILSQGISQLSTTTTSSCSSILLSDGSNELMDMARNIALGLTAVIFLFAGVTYVTAAVIIPAATKQLEKEAKELAPGLWEEYEARLNEGETMGQRPDLLQELTKKMEPLVIEYETKKREQAMNESGTDIPSPPPAGSMGIPTEASQWEDEEDDGISGEQIETKSKG